MPARLAGGLSRRLLPAARSSPTSSRSRGACEQGERELASQRLFWERWGDFFDDRDVRTADGALRIVYVTEDTGVGGGHRDIFEHLNRLAERGHEAALYTLGGPPDWFDLRAPVRTLRRLRRAGRRARRSVDAIKVATWWDDRGGRCGAPRVARGIPVYFVQDIETSYYPDDERDAPRGARLLPPGVPLPDDLGVEPRAPARARRCDAELIAAGHRPRDLPPAATTSRAATTCVLALGRTNPLKNLPLTLAAWRALRDAAARSCACSASSPSSAERYGVRYVERAAATSRSTSCSTRRPCSCRPRVHEGFACRRSRRWPPAAPVVCTDAHGNRDFCRDGVNCLMPEPTPAAVRGARAPARRPGAARAAGRRGHRDGRRTTPGSGASTRSRPRCEAILSPASAPGDHG